MHQEEALVLALDGGALQAGERYNRGHGPRHDPHGFVESAFGPPGDQLVPEFIARKANPSP